CWLSTEHGFSWVFLAPVISILTVGAFHSICIINQIIRYHLCLSIAELSCYSSIHSWIKSALVLMVILGSTWLLGVFNINQSSITMVYLFTILNTLQGFLIFLFHCLLNKKVGFLMLTYIMNSIIKSLNSNNSL
ncbi:hypothetical protein HELRODRAFT_80788, partial [Helobdella robusta]|uniref:G-protein coupled receptors family 2 profile 2 domain-containing protein n=1 Tax=Helobdella robusta TaxID=6412 RepID=T1G454_HELRO